MASAMTAFSGHPQGEGHQAQAVVQVGRNPDAEGLLLHEPMEVWERGDGARRYRLHAAGRPRRIEIEAAGGDGDEGSGGVPRPGRIAAGDVNAGGTAAPPAPPEAGPTAFRRFRFAARPLGGIPVGDFGDRAGTSPGVSFDFVSHVGRTHIAVGAELDYLMYGKETRRVSLVPAVPEVLTDVNTTNNLLLTHAVARVQPQPGRVRPYVEGLFGFRYVFTRTSFTNPDEGTSGSTLLGDFAPSAAAGAGLTVELVSNRDARLNLDFGGRLLAGCLGSGSTAANRSRMASTVVLHTNGPVSASWWVKRSSMASTSSRTPPTTANYLRVATSIVRPTASPLDLLPRPVPTRLPDVA